VIHQTLLFPDRFFLDQSSIQEKFPKAFEKKVKVLFCDVGVKVNIFQ
jgi:hypothetical protein